ncbi:MAG: circularly permuted type 2 ATP-grasp protein [Candidatus Wallbacteria bacterium]|nr:circularly permuted type 2 ATP-grasp protein [Candidatus Wallbacteria bacterium]
MASAQSNTEGSGEGRRKSRKTESVFSGYFPYPSAYDELFNADGSVRPEVEGPIRLLDTIGRAQFKARQRLADSAFLKGGITFSVYSDQRGTEKLMPFDPIPRLVTGDVWDRLSRGLVQRIRALDAFLGDVYGRQRILEEKRLPRDIVEASAGYRKQLAGIVPRGRVFIHVAGVDLIRGPDGSFAVLEDNVRTPSGVSYVLANRTVMKRVFPSVFTQSAVRSVDAYPVRLRDALGSLSPRKAGEDRLVVLTPGPFNSAYFEHSFLARRMGIDLVQPSDLFAHDDKIYVKTTAGPSRVDVIYRRIDDEFLDPTVFREDSVLGVPGIVKAYAAGNVTLANALGNGVADDKAIYPFVPEMIRFYLSEEPVLAQVETLICAREADCKRVLQNLGKMVVKAVDASGGYGMLMGPTASKPELAEFANRIRANPRGYIAQPRIELSTCPTWTGKSVEPRRVDMRPYVVSSGEPWVLPGGLTRVALVDGSYVVNSSQGGGSKDTWVLETSSS